MVSTVGTVGLELEGELAIEAGYAQNRTRCQVGVIVTHDEDPGAAGTGDGGFPTKVYSSASIGRLETDVESEGEITGGVVLRVGAHWVGWQGRLP